MKDVISTVVVDLKPSEKDIMENLHKDARWGINKALKEGLEVSQFEGMLPWSEYYQIYSDSMKAVGVKHMEFDELKRDTAALFICKKDGKIIAGATVGFPKDVFAYEDFPTLRTNASLEEYRTFQPNNLLYWECIRWCKINGYTTFDLGGWQINAKDNAIGVNRFKERWGKVIYYEKDFSFFRALGRKAIRKFKFLWYLNKLLKRLRDN